MNRNAKTNDIVSEIRELAKRQPNRIPELQNLVSAIESEFDGDLFVTKSHLYRALGSAPSTSKQKALLNKITSTINEVDREGRFSLQRGWDYSFSDQYIMNVFWDAGRDQFIICTSPHNSRNAGVYAFNRQSGGLNWQYQMKANESAWNPILSGSHGKLFFTTQSHRDNDDRHVHRLHCIDLAMGSLLWKYPAKKVEYEDEVKQIRGGYKKFILVNNNRWSLKFIDVENGEEKAEAKSSCRISGRIFQDMVDQLCVQTHDREIGWFAETGKQLGKLLLPFNKQDKDSGLVDRTLWDKGVLYVSVWDSRAELSNPTNSRPANVQKSLIYAIEPWQHKILWSLELPDMRVFEIHSDDKYLYFVDNENITCIVDRKNGKLVQRLPNTVVHATNKHYFYPDDANRFRGHKEFFAHSQKTDRITWARKDFRLLQAGYGLLFGQKRDEKNLVVLDETTGKELAAHTSAEELREVILLDQNHFLAYDKHKLYYINRF